MAPIGTLWTTPQQFKGKAIRAAALLGGLEIQIAENYTHFVDNKKPEFLSKFPHGKIPAFERANGFTIAESQPIARYIAGLAPNSGLLGHSLKDAALVDQWIHLAETEMDDYTELIRELCERDWPYNKAAHTFILERQLRTLKTLDAHLAVNTFFVGERITLADLYVAALVQKAVSVTIDAALRPKLPSLIRHMETIVNQPKLVDIFGKTVYAEKALQFVPPAKKAAT